MASNLYGFNATIIIFVFVFYCIYKLVLLDLIIYFVWYVNCLFFIVLLISFV